MYKFAGSCKATETDINRRAMTTSEALRVPRRSQYSAIGVAKNQIRTMSASETYA